MSNVQETPETKTLTLYKFTNQSNSQYLDQILEIFYRGVDSNTIGVMTAYNTKTEKEEVLLVGIQLDADNKPECFPLAKVLRNEEVLDYLAPNGKGGYYDMTNPEDVAEAKKDIVAAPVN